MLSPIQERIEVINYIKQNPLQMRLYGFVLDYGTEIKFVGAFAIGFLTQVIFHELSI